MNDNLFNCDLTALESPLPFPERADCFGVLSYWSHGWWVPPKEWSTYEGAQKEAEKRAKNGHTHISIVRIPGAQKP